MSLSGPNDCESQFIGTFGSAGTARSGSPFDRYARIGTFIGTFGNASSSQSGSPFARNLAGKNTEISCLNQKGRTGTGIFRCRERGSSVLPKLKIFFPFSAF